MKHKDFLSIADLTSAEISKLLDVARQLKIHRHRSADLKGKTLGMIFQKPSTRTAVSFSVGMYELGGYSLPLNARDLQLKRGESMADTARTLSRYLSGIMIRADRHRDIQELAQHASIPVINGLTEKEHPCQVMADLLTVMEAFELHKTKELKDIRVAYVGDGNNMTHSWMLAAGLLGFTLVVSCPEGYDPEKEYIQKASAFGDHVVLERDPQKAVAEASVIYTDVWASMGKEEETDRRKQIFKPYQVNEALVALAKKDAVVMHCLPAHREEEITNAVLEGPQSIVFEQVENRLHIQKAILLHCLK